ncbi:MAG: hypothetical protein H6832_15620 [Planctomycetes bacterium]|nr:hypothetical protein [Planctomycetota bacterium]
MELAAILSAFMLIVMTVNLRRSFRLPNGIRAASAASCFLVTVLVMTACKSDDHGARATDHDRGSMAKSAKEAAGTEPQLLADAPRAIEHEGRIFIIGTEAGAASFAANKMLPFTKSMIGEGPKGETVIVEATQSGTDLADRLWKQWSVEHVFYAERERDGRIYVLGTRASLAKFENGDDLTYTRTLIGEGPKGETIIIEVDPENPGFVERLQTQFLFRHPAGR